MNKEKSQKGHNVPLSKEEIEKKPHTVESLLEKFGSKEKKAEEYKDKWLRTLAEYENLKKRFEKEKIEFLKFSNEQILLELLPIIDHFDRAEDAARQHKHGEVFSKGVEMILKELHRLLERNGVEKVKTVGEKFNPHIHEGIAVVDTCDHPDEAIAEEISPGYLIHGKLLRAAKVKIYQNKKNENDGGKDKNG
ncbi:MAG: nucleotide exchange factor GrpE [Omnitrophica bacterium]|nr:nucleotide exchange factor GrpE [Candidatus Omnitrophota bacterium]